MQAEVARRGGLGLKRFGTEMIGPCPQCGGHDRFAVSITKRCFVCRGCDAAGDIIALVQHIDCDFQTAVQTLGGEGDMVSFRKLRKETARPISLANQADIDRQNIQRMLKIWNDAGSIDHPIARAYFERRELHDLPGESILRFHPSCPFGKTRHPCVLSLYTDIATNEPKAIGRTALSAAGAKIGRMGLGPVGGAAIKIDDDTNVELGLAIGEGLDTVLAARQLGFRPAWALGSAATCSERWQAAGVEVTRIVPRAVGADMANLIEQGGSRHAG